MLDSRMGSTPLRVMQGGRELRETVAMARARLKSIEERHEQLVEGDSLDLRVAGLAYAAAVHEYSSAVMAWLIWLDRDNARPELLGQQAAKP